MSSKDSTRSSSAKKGLLPAPTRPLNEFEQQIYGIAQHFSTKTDGPDRWNIDIPALALTFDSASLTPQPTMSFTMTIARRHCNLFGNLHGGCAATLFDALSSMILLPLSKPGVFQMGGVSRHLDVTYLRPVPAGSTVKLKTTVVSMGKRLALLRCEIVKVGENGEEGDVCMVCDHEKANSDPEVKKL
ncbi:HotDog domain-containing protein [Aspergillus unguis]